MNPDVPATRQAGYETQADLDAAADAAKEELLAFARLVQQVSCLVLWYTCFIHVYSSSTVT
jgi:hypothetical protein